MVPLRSFSSCTTGVKALPSANLPFAFTMGEDVKIFRGIGAAEWQSA